MANSMTCPKCKTRYTASGGKTFKQSMPSLPQPTAPRVPMPSVPAPLWASKTGQRLMQAGVSAGFAFIATHNVATTIGTGATVWFVSLIGGSGNWGVVKSIFDRNKDGRLDKRDLHDMVDWWKKGDDEPETPKLPPIPVHVIRGGETLMGEITGTTQEQLREAAKIMFTVANQGRPFARDRVGKVFGSNFSNIQKEMRKLGLLEGNKYTGYKLTAEGRMFLGRYHPTKAPSPTPDPAV